MINWQTGEITLPELTLHPGITADQVLTVMRDKVKVLQAFEFDQEECPDEENQLLYISLFMSEPPVVAEKITLEALEFDAYGALTRYVLSPTDIGDDASVARFKAKSQNLGRSGAGKADEGSLFVSLEFVVCRHGKLGAEFTKAPAVSVVPLHICTPSIKRWQRCCSGSRYRPSCSSGRTYHGRYEGRTCRHRH